MKTFIFVLNVFSAIWICRATPVGYFTKSRSLASFSYDPERPNSPEHWDEFATGCGGVRQSPINIQTSDAIRDLKLKKIKGTKWSETPASIVVENNGHTVKLEFEYTDGKMPVITVKGDEYEFVQLHYHFGTNSIAGSEHTINNVAYAMEGHAVFFNRKYGSFTAAQLESDGLTVIGRLFNENYYTTNINVNFDFLRNVREPDETYVLNKKSDLFSLAEIMGPLDWSYYMYDGSLTTPGCNEIVIWVVGAKPLNILSKSLGEFRQLNGHEGLMTNNYRPVQNLNDRIISYRK